MNNSLIQEYFGGKTILITGATGYVGSVLLASFLEHIPLFTRIYCLYRDKRGPEHPRVTWIKGDLLEPEWGLDASLLEEFRNTLQIIFHLGAYTRWDKPVREQVVRNTLPSVYAGRLASECKQLEACVVASSYWAALDKKSREVGRVKEEIACIGGAEEELAEVLAGTEGRLSEWPNAYSYSKCLAERLIQERYPHLPIIIARLTSVCGAWSFPQRGYSRFDNALPALLRSVALGGCRYFPQEMRSAVNDCIPVDLCVNLLLANVVEHHRGGSAIIHLSSGMRNLITMGQMLELAGQIEYCENQERTREKISTLTNPRTAKLNQIILDNYQIGLTESHIFEDDNARKPLTWMNASDRALFSCDVTEVNWHELIGSMVDVMKKQAAMG